MTKRIFVGIELPLVVKDYLKSIQQPEVRWIKWLKPDNFHITLSFLGEIAEPETEKAKNILAAVAGETLPFKLDLGVIRGEHDMLWVLPRETWKISDLQSKLKIRLKQAGVGKREKRHYFPHVLLAKSKTGRRMDWQAQNFQPQEFPVTQINLYESRLTPGTATHILLQTFPLTENPQEPDES